MPIISGSSGGGTQGAEIGYDQITAGVNVVGLTQGAGTTIITCAAHTFDGGAVICSFYCPQLGLSTVLGDAFGVTLNESGAAICDLAFLREAVAASQQAYKAVYAEYRFTPTAGAHSYVITAYTASTSGTPVVGAGTGAAGGVVPTFVRFTRV